jgi:hypothetical protein
MRFYFRPFLLKENIRNDGEFFEPQISNNPRKKTKKLKIGFVLDSKVKFNFDFIERIII